MDPQLMAALGMNMPQQGLPGLTGMPPNIGALLAAKLGAGGGAGAPGGGMPPAPPTPGAPGAPMPGGAAIPPPASNPGMMATPAPQQSTSPSGNGNLAGDSSNAAGNAGEPTSQAPNAKGPPGSLPHFPRNSFGAMLLPKGGMISQTGQPPTPGFNFGNLLQSFLQRMPGTGGGLPQGTPNPTPPMG